ncbi:MAG: plasmid pRiA4b ORF-3 family protein [Ilumatobacteraceae bacterium]
MNEFAFQGEFHVLEGLTDLEALSYWLSSLILDRSTTATAHPTTNSPPCYAKAPNVVELRPRAAPPAVPRYNQARVPAEGDAARHQAAGVAPIVVHASTPLDRLHEYIQAAFGWWNYHPTSSRSTVFATASQIPTGTSDRPPGMPTHCYNVADVGDSFKHTYDFGDGWDHKITIEKSIPIAPGMIVPACTDGRRACPPEDCGGTWGYEELLRISSPTPSHPEHEERVMGRRMGRRQARPRIVRHLKVRGEPRLPPQCRT